MEDDSSPSPTVEVDAGEFEEEVSGVVVVEETTIPVPVTYPITGVASRSSSTSSTQRNSWMKLTDTRVVDGQSVVVYPWLEDESNSKDKSFISLLWLYRPYKVGFGQKNAQWKKLEDHIVTEEDLFGNKCFPKKPCMRSLRDRFSDYMSFAKNFNRSVAFRSGCDDEIQYELLDQLIELHSDYDSRDQGNFRHCRCRRYRMRKYHLMIIDHRKMMTPSNHLAFRHRTTIRLNHRVNRRKHHQMLYQRCLPSKSQSPSAFLRTLDVPSQYSTYWTSSFVMDKHFVHSLVRVTRRTRKGRKTKNWERRRDDGCVLLE
jgi:hypothetical protein